MIPWYRTLKTLEIRASFMEDMKSERAITTACHLFAHVRSTLLVYCASATWKVSVIAVCIPDDLSVTPYRRCRPHKGPGSSGQTSLVAATYQSVRFASTLVTRFDAGQPNLLTCVYSLK